MGMVMQDIMLLLSCLYMGYSHQQMYLINCFVSILVLLFLSFFSMSDIYLMSIMVCVIYSGAMVISFMFVMMMLDVNIFNVSNNMILVWFVLFINQHVYNVFSFLLFLISFLFNKMARKVYMF